MELRVGSKESEVIENRPIESIEFHVLMGDKV